MKPGHLRVRLGVSLTLGLLLAACDHKSPASADAASAAGASAPASAAVSVAVPSQAEHGGVDAGRIQSVPVTATGMGETPAEAVDEAIRLALLQVNGVAVEQQGERYHASMHAAAGVDQLSIQSEGFAQQVVQRSGGVVSSFKLVKLVEPVAGTPAPATVTASGAASGGAAAAVKARKPMYSATIDAVVAKFEAPVDARKLKIVIGPIQSSASSFQVGGQTVSADKLKQDIRDALLTALNGSGRFVVLEREQDEAVQAELDMLADGRAPKAELAKGGQAVTADVIWVGTLNQFAYTSQARHLETSDRPLVSYSGGWSLSQRLVNVATRQIMLSDTVKGALPSTAPTTLSTGVDGSKMMAEMRQGLIASAIASILQRTFPVTVASRDGMNVILSQGGQSVVAGARYEAVILGKEVKDPQTGAVLGKVEGACCEVVVDKVDANMSYAHLENVTATLDGLPPGAIALRARVSGTAGRARASASAAEGAETVKPQVAGRHARVVAGSKAAHATGPSAVAKPDDNW